MLARKTGRRWGIERGGEGRIFAYATGAGAKRGGGLRGRGGGRKVR